MTTLIYRRLADADLTLVCGHGLAALLAWATESGRASADGQLTEPLIFTADVLSVCGEAYQPDIGWAGLVADAAELAEQGQPDDLTALVDIANDCLLAISPPAVDETERQLPDDLVARLNSVTGVWQSPAVGTDEWHAAYGGYRYQRGQAV